MPINIHGKHVSTRIRGTRHAPLHNKDQPVTILLKVYSIIQYNTGNNTHTCVHTHTQPRATIKSLMTALYIGKMSNDPFCKQNITTSIRRDFQKQAQSNANFLALYL